ncbi:hypothetical protein DTO027B5_1532 [Paecilomyces variotii]|nr:hypothetical protein DTO169C6_4566 [Paecilomyces variotii]KAJ9287919.1 hypothetical protein DTO021C3_4529 [Paecilomyces variotii]KAJ9323221.1 hypothetical protein DTO027B3_5792 [Paecilomyces variotii]KAJ9336611.1 hypothetical protein DTO027B5_1532 [Paecilomyces variotii]KAJ9361136.1 hypothetical protein DTO027B9_985 [Paecilomyces variotii]
MPYPCGWSMRDCYKILHVFSARILKQLGIPTANIPPDGLSAYPDLQTGVYYGVVALDPAKFIYDKNESTAHTVADTTSTSTPTSTKQEQEQEQATILPAVLSIGYNPFYKNTVRSVEIHIMSPPTSTTNTTTTSNNFNKLPDFYSTKLNLLILGYIRPEYDYVSLEALIDDIRTDCEVAKKSLAREAYVGYLEDGREESEKVREEKRWLRSFSR